jgi:hypothetical protein
LNIQTKQPSRKLDYQRLGPLKIIVQINLVSYCLGLEPAIQIHPIFHVSLLEPYIDLQIPNRISPLPLPIEIHHEAKYEIEEILDSRL